MLAGCPLWFRGDRALDLSLPIDGTNFLSVGEDLGYEAFTPSPLGMTIVDQTNTLIRRLWPHEVAYARAFQKVCRASSTRTAILASSQAQAPRTLGPRLSDRLPAWHSGMWRHSVLLTRASAAQPRLIPQPALLVEVSPAISLLHRPSHANPARFQPWTKFQLLART